MNDEVGSSLKTANDSERNVDVKLLEVPALKCGQKRIFNLMFTMGSYEFGKENKARSSIRRFHAVLYVLCCVILSCRSFF